LLGYIRQDHIVVEKTMITIPFWILYF